jgi:hypothetical protein
MIHREMPMNASSTRMFNACALADGRPNRVVATCATVAQMKGPVMAEKRPTIP